MQAAIDWCPLGVGMEYTPAFNGKLCIKSSIYPPWGWFSWPNSMNNHKTRAPQKEMRKEALTNLLSSLQGNKVYWSKTERGFTTG